jgi:hypothetical protein
MSTPEFAALRLADGVLAPAGSGLVLAEWTADGAVGDQPLYQAPCIGTTKTKPGMCSTEHCASASENNTARSPLGER